MDVREGRFMSAMSEVVLLACGHSAAALHDGEHDGLTTRHPSCVICASGAPGDPACTVVPWPSLDGRKARCGSYGSAWGRNVGPIYPDDKTRNDGQCSRERGCWCVVPSSRSLPFFGFGEQPWEERCGVITPAGLCRGSRGLHDLTRIPDGLISLEHTRYAGKCGHCGQTIRSGEAARWDREHQHIYHVEGGCEALTHPFARLDVAEDSFYCGCSGWD